MRILIDADACPVVDIALRIAGARGIEVILFCDSAHAMVRENVETVTVMRGADSADFALVNRAKPKDIVVTQDYGLAAMCLARGARPINQNGLVYTDANIDALLASRHTAKKIRNAGGRLKGPPKRTKDMDEKFERALVGLVDGADEPVSPLILE